jgi:hypothetical protein
MNRGVGESEGQDQNGERHLLGLQYEILRLNGWYGMLLNHVWIDVEKNYPIGDVALRI